MPIPSESQCTFALASLSLSYVRHGDCSFPKVQKTKSNILNLNVSDPKAFPGNLQTESVANVLLCFTVRQFQNNSDLQRVLCMTCTSLLRGMDEFCINAHVNKLTVRPRQACHTEGCSMVNRS